MERIPGNWKRQLPRYGLSSKKRKIRKKKLEADSGEYSNSRVASFESFAEARSVVEGKGGSLRKSRILAVDEDDYFLTVLESLLRKQHVITACENAEEAYSALLKSEFDLLICDFLVPEDGIPLVNQIRATRGLESLPVVLLTASDAGGLTLDVLRSAPNVTLLPKTGSLKTIRDVVLDLCPKSRIA